MAFKISDKQKKMLLIGIPIVAVIALVVLLRSKNSSAAATTTTAPSTGTLGTGVAGDGSGGGGTTIVSPPPTPVDTTPAPTPTPAATDTPAPSPYTALSPSQAAGALGKNYYGTYKTAPIYAQDPNNPGGFVVVNPADVAGDVGSKVQFYEQTGEFDLNVLGAPTAPPKAYHEAATALAGGGQAKASTIKPLSSPASTGARSAAVLAVKPRKQ